MEHRILTVPTKDVNVGWPDRPIIEVRPDIAFAGDIERGAGDICLLYADETPGVGCKRSRQPIAAMWEKSQSGSSGIYVVCGEKAILDTLGAGPTLAEYIAASVDNKRGWPIYRCDGTMPDPADGGKIKAFERKLIEFKTLAPANDASVGDPWPIGTSSVTKSWPSIPGTVAWVNMVELAEQGLDATPRAIS